MTPEQQLLILLRFLASGNMQITVGDVVKVSQTTVSRVLPKVCIALLGHFDTFIRMPETLEERNEACRAFFKFSEFPRTIGAIDCTHVKIQSPGGELVCALFIYFVCVMLSINFQIDSLSQSEVFRNRKGYFSLNVQTISSADLKVLNVVARWPGSAHDQKIFRNCNLYDRFKNGDFGANILVGDSGYANTPFLATPFTANNNEINQNMFMQVYQASIIKTRNVVERQYGVIKRRFPALAYGMRVKVATAQKLIAVACILHNICIDANEPLPPLDDNIESFLIAMEESQPNNEYDEDIGDQNQRRGRQRNNNARDCILHMFRRRENAQN